MEGDTSTKRKKFKNSPDCPNDTHKTFTEDTTHLLNILPEEMWNLVLAQVDNASGYYKICAASSLFQTLLSSYRTQALLPDMLKALVNRFEKEPYEDGDTAHSVPNFARMRLVCRAWKKGVNHFLEDKSVKDKLFYVPGQPSFNTQFENLSDVIEFQTHFETTHLSTNANPFPARKLEITLPEMADQLKTFYKAVLSVLQNYGKHVWNVQISSKCKAVSARAKIFSQFKVMLGFLPNLRVLKADFYKLTEGDCQRLMATCKYAPFPTPPKLQNIQQFLWPFPLFKEFIKPVLSNLDTVRIGFLKAEDFKEFCSLGLRLNTLKIFASPLSTSCGNVFSALERGFGETLTDLFIWLPRPVPVQFEHRLKLPKLKRLVMRMDFAVPLDFLLDIANNLELLSIVIDSVRRLTFKRVKKREQVIKFYTHLDNLHDSNIWTEFPKLQKVDICPWLQDYNFEINCTREQWQARHEGVEQ